MGFKEVFHSLEEIFPQVDIRILKAVAIEHANDVDAAVEFILSDVVPSIIGSCETSCTLKDTDEIEHSTAVGKGKQPILVGHQEVEEGTASYLAREETVACDITFSNGYTSSGHVLSPCNGKVDHRDSEVGIADYSKGLECPTMHYNASEELSRTPDLEPNFMEKGIDLNCDVEDIVLHPKSHVHEKFVDVALCDMNDQVNVFLASSNAAHDEYPLEQSVMPSCIGGSETVMNVFHDRAENLDELYLSVAASYAVSDVENVSLQPCERNSDPMENRKITKGGSYSVHGSEERSGQPDNPQGLYQLEVADTVSAAITLTEDIEVCGGPADSWGCGINEVSTATSEYEEPHSKLVDESTANLLSFESGMLSANDNNLPATLVTRSGHFVNTEFLEDLISDAKRDKENLISAMELTTNMMREVQLLEERSKQAKEAASTAGQDTLSKVEELKNILKHAKEANDMHAGEVYGEKAILATEARELQSRLLGLSDERNKSLLMIEEIRETLGVRLATMEEEIAVAEQEMRQKEALARKALSEQEAIMASVVEESKRLQQEAEENSKLREFLMDRGRLVDALQGEIAVICEDVALIKERVDGHVPFSRSFLSPLNRSLPLSPNRSPPSTSSSLVASSSSSYHGTKHSSNGILVNEDFSEKPAITEQEQEQHEIQQTEKGNLSGDTSGASLDDGWELLKDGVLCNYANGITI